MKREKQKVRFEHAATVSFAYTCRLRWTCCSKRTQRNRENNATDAVHFSFLSPCVCNASPIVAKPTTTVKNMADRQTSNSQNSQTRNKACRSGNNQTKDAFESIGSAQRMASAVWMKSINEMLESYGCGRVDRTDRLLRGFCLFLSLFFYFFFNSFQG